MNEENIPAVTPDLPARGWRIALAALRRLPQGAMSRSFGRLADTPLPKALRKPVLSAFARGVGIDISEAERPLDEYASLNAFFVRKLKPGARPWRVPANAAGSPVDGVIGQLGAIRDGTLMQAKGRSYSAAALLDDEAEAQRFQGGSFLTLYLSPRHYHRIHAPCGGAIPKAIHIPGALLPVNAPSVSHVPNLFATNERLLCYIDGPLGRVAVVAIGAYNVGRISASFDEEWSKPVTNRAAAKTETHNYDPPITIAGGAEIMAFHLGSTVVMLFEPKASLATELVPGADIRLGSPIAQ